MQNKSSCKNEFERGNASLDFRLRPCGKCSDVKIRRHPFYSFPLGGGRWAIARMRGALLSKGHFFFTPHPASGHPLPQGAREQKIGFTLIELLVVVLIIGILAAVALPHYKMAVAKARMSTLLGMMNAVKQAQETYYLANGSYANDINELSVSLPGQSYPPLPNRAVYSPNAWTLDINDSTIGVMGQDARVSGVQIYFFHDHISHEWKGKHLCYARMSNDFANKICQNLTNRKTPNSNNGPNTNNIYFFK